MEVDEGKSSHDLYEGERGVDWNRAEKPHREIVSEPEITNAKEAVAYVKAIIEQVTF